ncbi:unnamed protein product [Closterium sp. Yama58-4]|nr:unnamed protein product [Closterium sp. Yama58-4]
MHCKYTKGRYSLLQLRLCISPAYFLSSLLPLLHTPLLSPLPISCFSISLDVRVHAAQIDNHRNQLIQLELVLNAGIMVTSISATVVGIFGMNIPYAWNTDPSAFVWVVVLGTLVPTLLFVALVWYARHRKILA